MESTDHFPRFRDYIRRSFPSWKDLKDSEITFILFNSITNNVYQVKAAKEGATPPVVILRHFCGKEGIVDKDKEIIVFREMSKTGFGPQCYGQEDDLRLEEYIPSRTIRPHEYKEKVFRRKLARTMAAIHKLEIPEIDNTSLFEFMIKDPKFFKMYDDKCEEDIYSPQEKEIIDFVRKASSKEELTFIGSIIPKNDIIFAHNDLLQGNVLITEGKEEVVFIDYEYASYNFRGYDIGNMFKEATFDYAVSTPPYFKIVDSNYPNEEELRDFLKYYLLFIRLPNSEHIPLGDELIGKDEIPKDVIERYYTLEELKEKEDALVKETLIGRMLSYYYWMVWGIKMHKTVDIQFDYLEFARYQFEEYLRLKKEVLNQ